MRLLLICFMTGFSSLSYEFMLAQMMALLEGNTIAYYCLTMALYICALGFGALKDTSKLRPEQVYLQLLRIEWGLVLLGGSSPILLTWFELLPSLLDRVSVPSLLFPSLLVILIGWLTGRELPLMMRLAEISKHESLVLTLLGLDYIASFVGALAFPLWIFPNFGMVQAGWLLACCNIVAALLLRHQAKHAWSYGISLSLALLIAFAFYFSQELQSYLSMVISEKLNLEA